MRSEITDRDDILLAEAEFYRNFYSAKVNDHELYDSEFLSSSISMLSDQSSMLCEGYINSKESWDAVIKQ